MALNLILIFSIIGILDTTYLIYAKIRKKDVYCLFFPKEWCQKVQYSKYSSTLGIPNAYAGFGMYAVILFLLYMYTKGSVDLIWLKSIITFGFLFSTYFLYVQAFILRAFCTWCVLSAINFIVMFVSVYFLI